MESLNLEVSQNLKFTIFESQNLELMTLESRKVNSAEILNSGFWKAKNGIPWHTSNAPSSARTFRCSLPQFCGHNTSKDIRYKNIADLIICYTGSIFGVKFKHFAVPWYEFLTFMFTLVLSQVTIKSRDLTFFLAKHWGTIFHLTFFNYVCIIVGLGIAWIKRILAERFVLEFTVSRRCS